MRKVIYIIVLWCGMLVSALALPRYSIFKIIGDVKVMQTGTWVVPAKKQGVTFRDQFLLGENARVGIVDNQTHRIYYSSKAGKQNVAQIISGAKKQADEVVGLINKQIRSAMISNEESRVPVAGVSYRGNRQDSTLAAVYAVLQRAIADSIGGSAEMLQVEQVKECDTFFFRIRNLSSTPLYVNILDCSSSTPRICFNVGYTCDEPFLLVFPQQTVDMTQFLFADDGNKLSLIPFATEVPVDVQALQMLLDRGAEVEKNQMHQEGIKVHLGVMKESLSTTK